MVKITSRFSASLRQAIVVGHSVLLIVVVSVFIVSGLVEIGHSQPEPASKETPGFYRPDYASFSVGYGSRSNQMQGFTLNAGFRSPLASDFDLEGRVFKRLFDDIGFGFGFVGFLPELVKIGSSGANIEPMLGANFTVWSPTVAIGVPMGFEFHQPIFSILDLSIGGTVEPQFNLNSDKNTVIVDARIGIRYHQ